MLEQSGWIRIILQETGTHHWVHGWVVPFDNHKEFCILQIGNHFYLLVTCRKDSSASSRGFEEPSGASRGRQCASKRVVYLLGPPTVLPEANFCAMADLNMATDVLVLVLWLSLFQSSVTRVAYEFFLISSLHLLTVRFNGSVVKRVILSGCAPTLVNSSSGHTLSLPLSIL